MNKLDMIYNNIVKNEYIPSLPEKCLCRHICLVDSIKFSGVRKINCDDAVFIQCGIPNVPNIPFFCRKSPDQISCVPSPHSSGTILALGAMVASAPSPAMYPGGAAQ